MTYGFPEMERRLYHDRAFQPATIFSGQKIPYGAARPAVAPPGLWKVVSLVSAWNPGGELIEGRAGPRSRGPFAPIIFWPLLRTNNGGERRGRRPSQNAKKRRDRLIPFHRTLLSPRSSVSHSTLLVALSLSKGCLRSAFALLCRAGLV